MTIFFICIIIALALIVAVVRGLGGLLVWLEERKK